MSDKQIDIFPSNDGQAEDELAELLRRGEGSTLEFKPR